MKIQDENGIWIDVSIYDGVGSGKVQDYYGSVYRYDHLTNRYVKE